MTGEKEFGEVRIVLIEEVVDRLRDTITEKTSMALQFEFKSVVTIGGQLGGANVTLQLGGSPDEPTVTLGPTEKLGD